MRSTGGAIAVGEAPDYLAQVQFTIKGLDYNKVSEAQRPALQQKLLAALAAGLGASTLSFTEQPGGPPGTLLLKPWVAGSTSLTGFLPNDPPTSSAVQRIRDKVSSQEMLSSLAQAVVDALGPANPAVVGDLQVTSPRVAGLKAPAMAAAASGCDWWCR